MYSKNELLVKISEHTGKIKYTSVVNCIVIVSKSRVDSLNYDLEIQASSKDMYSLPHASHFSDKHENLTSLNSI